MVQPQPQLRQVPVGVASDVGGMLARLVEHIIEAGTGGQTQAHPAGLHTAQRATAAYVRAGCRGTGG